MLEFDLASNHGKKFVFLLLFFNVIIRFLYDAKPFSY